MWFGEPHRLPKEVLLHWARRGKQIKKGYRVEQIEATGGGIWHTINSLQWTRQLEWLMDCEDIMFLCQWTCFVYVLLWTEHRIKYVLFLSRHISEFYLKWS
jgi:hypothetical protein